MTNRKTGKVRAPDEVDMSDLITQSEAAELRGVSLSAIANLVKRGRLDRVERFGKTLVKRSQVQALDDLRGWPKGKLRKGGN
jgi:predicted transcriptional regulator of viral defense system